MCIRDRVKECQRKKEDWNLMGRTGRYDCPVFKSKEFLKYRYSVYFKGTVCRRTKLEDNTKQTYKPTGEKYLGRLRQRWSEVLPKQ